MWNTKTDADPVIRKVVELIRRHRWGSLMFLVQEPGIRTPALEATILLRRWFAAIGRAATLPFARVLSLATIVAGFATALALTGVLALAGVLVFLTGILLKRNASFCADIRGMRLHCRRTAH